MKHKNFDMTEEPNRSIKRYWFFNFKLQCFNLAYLFLELQLCNLVVNGNTPTDSCVVSSSRKKTRYLCFLLVRINHTDLLNDWFLVDLKF